MANPNNDIPNETNQDQLIILRKSETYVKQIICISSGSLTIDMVIMFLLPVYLEEEFNASGSLIGVGLFLQFITRVIVSPAIVFLAESKSKYLIHCSYDIMTVIRLFLSIIVIVMLANVHSAEAFITFGVLNMVFSIQDQTTVGCISLLLPQQMSDKYMMIVSLGQGASVIFGSLILSVTLFFLTYQQLFYV